MNIGDAVKTLTFRKKSPEKNQLMTVWGEKLMKESRNAPDEYAVLTEYPRPQMRRDNYRILNGWWNYRITDRDADRDADVDEIMDEAGSCWDGQILVPFSPESRLSGVERQLMPEETLLYEREVLFDPEELAKYTQKRSRLLLHFGAVDQRCTVCWNGTELGGHLGGYLPFTFDVTDYVQERNMLRVQVWDDSDTSYHARGKQTLCPGGMFYTAQSGIWQTVWLEWVPENFIESVRITPDCDKRTVRAELTVKRGQERRLEIRERRLSESEFHLWSPEDPYLYDWELMVDGDRVQTYFAMRKVEIGADRDGVPRLFLNGSPYYQHGVLDQGYFPDGLMTAPSDEAFVFDILSMKNAGFNMIRKHIKIEPLRWYYHCDRLGMLVWQDMVNGGGPIDLMKLTYLPTAVPWIRNHMRDTRYRTFSRESLDGRKEWLAECRETVKHLYNCPSICLWVPFNEGWGQFEAKRVYDMIRKADATRLIDHASGWVDQGCGDVKSIHNYFQKLRVKPDKAGHRSGQRSGGRPVVYSEYGGYACYVKGHSYSSQVYGYRNFKTEEALAEAFGRLQKRITEMKQDGLCADVYTQVSDVEDEVNGILTYDRRVNKLGQELPETGGDNR